MAEIRFILIPWSLPSGGINGDLGHPPSFYVAYHLIYYKERDMKSGIKTSEFWVTIGTSLSTIIGSLVALFVGLNYFDEQTGELVKMVAISVITLAMTVAPAYLGVRYAQGRTELKKAEQNGNK